MDSTTSRTSSLEVQLECDSPHLISSISIFASARVCELYFDDEYFGTLTGSTDALENGQMHSFLLLQQDFIGHPREAKKVNIKVSLMIFLFTCITVILPVLFLIE